MTARRKTADALVKGASRLSLPQRRRVAVAAGYLLSLATLSWKLFGHFVPPPTSDGAWFYAGVAVVVLSKALTEPFYASPAAALANAIAALLATVAYSPGAVGPSGAGTRAVEQGRLAILGFSVLVIALALGAILTKDALGKAGAVSQSLARASGAVGSARVVFSVLFLASVYASYARNPGALFVLFLAWVTVVGLHPLERLASREWPWISPWEEPLGRVVGLRHPGVAEVGVASRGNLQPGSALLLGSPRAAGTVLDVAPTPQGWRLLVSIPESRAVGVGDGVFAGEADAEAFVLGPIEPGSELTDICFRVPPNVASLREGHLVSVLLRDQRVLYQVVAAKVRTERVEAGIEHRFIEVTARKIGVWNEEKRAFSPVPWLPMPGASVNLELAPESPFQPGSIGVVPDSSFGISVDTDDLVTHNTAILGILGIGKTYLAFELIRRVLAAGCKVLVLDITGQYADHFRDVFPESYEANTTKTIQDAIKANRDVVKMNVQEGGNINDFRDAVHADLAQFVKSEYRLKIVNPAEFDVTRQDSKVFSGEAALALVTMVEATRVFAEALLDVLSNEMTDRARVCLVLEEAHSLVPEWNSTTYEGDQRASNGAAKAILQGRKYGLGVMMITQRTANVTKTILNQCNTIFALRIYDATGMDFLKNYIGASYADVLSSLADRTAVVFGRASSCPSPVIIRVNDHETMVREYWNNELPNIPCPQATPEIANGADDEPPF